MAPQLANMALLYLFIGLLNRRSRMLGDAAARQVRPQCNLYVTVAGTRSAGAKADRIPLFVWSIAFTATGGCACWGTRPGAPAGPQRS